jgi:hypothetical protein
MMRFFCVEFRAELYAKLEKVKVIAFPDSRPSFIKRRRR